MSQEDSQSQPRPPWGGLEGLVLELRTDQLAVLERIGTKLRAKIDRLQEIRRALADRSSEAADALGQEYAEVHKLAEEYLCYLAVQLEVTGLRESRWLLRLYKIPPPLPCDEA